MRFTDPTGHCTGDPDDPQNPDKECWRLYNNFDKWFPNVTLGDHSEWTATQLANLFKALKLTKKAFGGQHGFQSALGFITIHGPNSIWAILAEMAGVIEMAPPGSQMIILTNAIFDDKNSVIFNILHEMGHIFDFRVAYYHSQNFINKFGEGCSDVGI